MKKFPFDHNNKNTNYFNINQINEKNNIPKKNSNKIEDDLPTEEEVYKNNNIKLNENNINIVKENGNYNYDYEDDIEENIKINIPRNNLSPFSRPVNSNIINNINNTNFNYNNINNNQYYYNNDYNNDYHQNYSNINNNFNNIYINNRNNTNQINRINSRSESFLDPNGNIIYRNNSNQNNLIQPNPNELDLVRLDSHRVLVGNDEFEDLTKEAREIQNKEAFEKKILGITKEKAPQDTIKKPFLERVGDFFSEHQEGIFAIIDGIGCILLHAPSIGRTIDRIDRWIDGWDDQPSLPENINNMESIGPGRRIILEKNKDYDTIMKFLPMWEIRENKNNSNNNKCVICLFEFNIGDKISFR